MTNIYYDINGKRIAHPELMRNEKFSKWFNQAIDNAEARGREEALKKVRKGKIFVSSYACIDCHKLIPNTCDRCRRLRSS